MQKTTPILSFEMLLKRLAENGRRRRVAVVCPYDESTQQAVAQAVDAGFADAVLVGEASRTTRFDELMARYDHVSHLPVATPEEAARTAVSLVRTGEADLLMKGLINTDTLLHAVLDKERGVLPRGHVLTHVGVAELPGWNRLLFFSDVAVIPQPTLAQRAAILGYGAGVCRLFGIGRPRMALLHYSEKVSERVPLTLDYRNLAQRAATGEWGDVVVDGPLDLRCALDETSDRVKGIESPLGGRADFLLFPDLEAGNTFYKALPLLCGARVAGMLQGAACPVVLPSRSDRAEDKYLSLALASFAAPSC